MIKWFYYKVLWVRFGLNTFRPLQLEAITATLSGENVFVLFPTAGGKSLCFLLPTVLTHGVTVVVSPLKSLIYDQIQNALQLNVTCILKCHLVLEKDNNSCIDTHQCQVTFTFYRSLLAICPVIYPCQKKMLFIRHCFQIHQVNNLINRHIRAIVFKITITVLTM